MALNDYDYRPITFEGQIFPASFMAISILEPVLEIQDEDLGDWLWRFPICCGVTKRAPAERCARCAQGALDLILERRQQVLEGIRERLAADGFDANATYCDWVAALQRIVELSSLSSSGECVWSAPAHAEDRFRSSSDRNGLVKELDRERRRITGSDGVEW